MTDKRRYEVGKNNWLELDWSEQAFFSKSWYDYTWLNSARPKIENLLFSLYTFLKTSPSLNNKQLIVFFLLTGIAFSLWRSVFLVEKEIPWGDKLKRARELLERLIKDNAVGYEQEKNFRNWTAGYYLNNAGNRLFEALFILDNLNISNFSHDLYKNSNIPEIKNFISVWEKWNEENILKDSDSSNEQDVWEKMIILAQYILNKLKVDINNESMLFLVEN